MKEKKKIVTGVIGYDIHYGGNVILQYALREAGFEVISLGTQVTQKDFISAAIEADADAILVSSLYGHAEIDCQGFGNACKEAGLNIPLYIGGNLLVGAEQLGKDKWLETESKFKEMGFTRVYSTDVSLETAIEDLKKDLGVQN